MALFPEVQKKAQEELDKHIGHSRLPEYTDLEALIYIQAIGLETLRWMPVIPIGVMHSSSADDVYSGYFIPKGSMIIAVNISSFLKNGVANLLINLWIHRMPGQCIPRGPCYAY